MRKQILLPCGLCGGDGYSPFHILRPCPECEGEGCVVGFESEDESELLNQSTSLQSDIESEEILTYEDIPF